MILQKWFFHKRYIFPSSSLSKTRRTGSVCHIIWAVWLAAPFLLYHFHFPSIAQYDSLSQLSLCLLCLFHFPNHRPTSFSSSFASFMRFAFSPELHAFLVYFPFYFHFSLLFCALPARNFALFPKVYCVLLSLRLLRCISARAILISSNCWFFFQFYLTEFHLHANFLL